MKTYDELNLLNDKSKDLLKSKFEHIIANLKTSDYVKFKQLFESIPLGLKITYNSQIHQSQRPKQGKEKGQHPIKPIRGQIYNAYLGENYGSELSGEHPVVIIQNDSGNLYAHKVIVVPIEGDGNKIDESYMIKLTNSNLIDGKTLTKVPSRIIVSEIMTLDKAKLGKLIGKLTPETIKDLNEKISYQLSIDK